MLGLGEIDRRIKKIVRNNETEGQEPVPVVCQVPKGVWHSIEVYEPSTIFEAKDGKYGE